MSCSVITMMAVLLNQRGAAFLLEKAIHHSSFIILLRY